MTRSALSLAPGLAVLGLLATSLVVGGGPGLSVAVATALVTGLAVAVHARGAAEIGCTVFGAGVLSTSWTGVSVGGLQIGDACFVLASVLLLPTLLRDPTVVRRLPRWLLVPAVLVALVALSHALFPVDPSYLASRFERVDPFVKYGGAAERLSGNAVNALRWEVSLLALPLLTLVAARTRRIHPLSVVRLWVIGVGLSALVAVTDELQLTRISSALLPLVDAGGRQAGLSGHPNQLAVSITVAVPFVVWLVVSRRENWALGVGVVLLAGALVSGSRGGALATVIGLVVTLAVLSGRDRVDARRAFWLIVPMLAAPLLYTLLAGESVLRLTNRDNATELASNAERRSTTGQALADLLHDPVRGVGLQVVSEAHNVVLQLLASGGVVLGVAGAVLWGGAVLAAWRERAALTGLALAVAVAVVAWVSVGLVENQLTDRYLYLPICLLLLVASHRANSTSVATTTSGERHAEPAHPA